MPIATLALLLTLQTAEPGFTPLFDGKSLAGWTLVDGAGPGYIVRDGVLVCPKDGGGKLLTEREYTNFVFRFEYKLAPGGNNGVGIRAPLEGDAAYEGIECQILDDPAPAYRNLRPYQYHGSLYGLVAAKPGGPKPAGEWNTEEITANGRRITVKVNGKTTVDADLNQIHDLQAIVDHPGMFRDRGRVGFLGHGPEEVQFRNIRIRELPHREELNRPPAGFRALYNGRNLEGWKGLVADPPKRAAMTADLLKEEQSKADAQMRDHWKSVDGTLIYDGKGNSLCTAKDYANFEMLVDWKILKDGDSGIYLRGSPQVQIWDRPEGSGGLYNNQKNPSKPLVAMDKPVGEWNRFRIVMVGEKVHIFLNGQIVVRETTLENYWERDKPIYPIGQIELQHHGNELQFRNVFLREIPLAKAR